MRLPDIQKRLREIAEDLNNSELALLADKISRRKPLSRAPRTSQRMSEPLAIAIRAFKAAHPSMSHQHIGEVFNVNSGRVTDAMRGKKEGV